MHRNTAKTEKCWRIAYYFITVGHLRGTGLKQFMSRRHRQELPPRSTGKSRLVRNDHP